jgi:hypothetical protein
MSPPLPFTVALLSLLTLASADLWCPEPYHAICTDTSQPGSLAPFFSILGNVVPATEYAECACKPERSVFTTNYCCQFMVVRT